MFLVILLSALAAFAVASTLNALTKDGYHRVPTDRMRLP
jgi:hypothetical protein